MYISVTRISIEKNYTTNEYEKKNKEILLNTDNVHYIDKDAETRDCNSRGLHHVKLANDGFYLDESNYQKLCGALGIIV